MNKILSQKNDPAFTHLYRIIESNVIPDYVKDASFNDICGSDDYPGEAFGDPARKEFPCHTPAACWVSTTYLKDAQDSTNTTYYNNIVTNIRRLANYHGNLIEIDNLLSKTPIKQASSNNDYLIDEELQDGQTLRMYRLETSEDVKAAASYLNEHRYVISYSDRLQMASKILKKAGDLGIVLDESLQESLEKQAGLATGSGTQVAEQLRVRSRLLAKTNPELSKELTEAANFCSSDPITSRTKLASLIETLDQLDHDNELNLLYEKGLDKPEDALMVITTKVASEFLDNHCRLANGNIYKINDFHKLSSEVLSNIMGEDFVKEVSIGGILSAEKLAEATSALPIPDAELIESLLHFKGVVPVAKEASEAKRDLSWLTEDALIRLASV